MSTTLNGERREAGCCRRIESFARVRERVDAEIIKAVETYVVNTRSVRLEIIENKRTYPPMDPNWLEDNDWSQLKIDLGGKMKDKHK